MGEHVGEHHHEAGAGEVEGGHEGFQGDQGVAEDEQQAADRRPEAASGGPIGLIRDGDIISINIPERSIDVELSDEELATRRAEQDERGWRPVARERQVSNALKIYASLALSADKGAARRELD